MSLVGRELEEFLQSGRYKDGLNRCNKLLKKSQKPPIVYAYKARFLHFLGLRQESEETIKTVLELPDLNVDEELLESFDDCISLARQDDTWPLSLTNGSELNELWNKAAQTTPRSLHPRLFKSRYSTAVEHRRWVDAGHALTAWKKAEPDRVDLRYMHAIVYQLIAENTTDSMTKRLNQQLAIKTCEQLAKTCKTVFHAQVVMQLFKRHGDPNKVALLHDMQTGAQSISDENTIRLLVNDLCRTFEGWEYLYGYNATEFRAISKTIERRGVAADEEIVSVHWQMVEAFLLAAKHTNRIKEGFDLVSAALDPHGRLRGIAILYKHQMSDDFDALAEAIVEYFKDNAQRRSCFSEIRGFALMLPESKQHEIRTKLASLIRQGAANRPGGDVLKPSTLVESELTLLKLDFLLTVGRAQHPSVDHIYTFLANILRLKDLSVAHRISSDLAILAATALYCAHRQEPDAGHLVLAVYLLRAEPHEYPAKVLLLYLYLELGLPDLALQSYASLGIKEIQHESMSHVIATRISISAPFTEKSRKALTYALDMYMPTMDRVAEQEVGLVDAKRPDLMFDLEDLRASLANSLTRRMLILESRRIARLQDRGMDDDYRLHPALVRTWTDDLKDGRSYNICEELCQSNENSTFEQTMHFGGHVPDANWIKYHLWIDQICSRVHKKSLVKDGLSSSPFKAENAPSSLTPEEISLLPFWTALGEVMAASPEGQDSKRKGENAALATTLEQLKGLVMQMPKSCWPIAAAATSHGMIGIRSINQVYLMMDFLKIASALCLNRLKGDDVDHPVIRSLLKGVMSQVREHFLNLKTFVASQRRVLSQARVRDTILRGLRRAGNQSEDQDPHIEACATSLNEAACAVMDSMTRIKLDT